eukprot:CAMPEP_0174716876 /NCGR_PEP_ID=MMETSP1094-20130205/25051_1 /TAXON_ID=156173 /ORGANISM="Chrysochromulina brevifilum, Strain UTEX LB 985" /LENGTH=79 /DNA_ID=CAMNT_0015916733 /DNA_START=65 /DNA_END=301 /DNA_ORIENTATION=+
MSGIKGLLGSNITTSEPCYMPMHMLYAYICLSLAPTCRRADLAACPCICSMHACASASTCMPRAVRSSSRTHAIEYLSS